jgi:Cu+-exporting ATPase
VNKIIFQDSFLVSGIMCHQECGTTVRNSLSNIETLKARGLLPTDAQLTFDAEPQALGVHRIFISITSNDVTEFNQQVALSEAFKAKIDDVGFEIIDNSLGIQKDKKNHRNQINILINVLSIIAIIILSAVFPPSLLLTIGLTVLSFLTTAFTARNYLLSFFRNLRHKNVTTMATPVTLGWFSSLAHTLYHSISMPLARSFSMTFMSFLMPVMLITIINTMDEIKRLVLNQSKKMHLKGVRELFPQMATEYACYQLPAADQHLLSEFLSQEPLSVPAFSIDAMLREENILSRNKNSLKKDMVIKVKRGECFPVDGLIIQGETYIDASILTGEHQQRKKPFDLVPAGAINLSEDVTFYATTDGYNSTINKLLFRSNRAQETRAATPANRKFVYLYTALIIIGIAASILVPVSLGFFAIPLLLQNVTGILFAICPCTMAIAHELPKLLSIYQRHKNGILLRNESLTDHNNNIHTIVFDKTGTLTTGMSQVDTSEGILPAVWQRIYLLEKNHGADHPLAKAISKHCVAINAHDSMIQDINEVSRDPQNRGLSAKVQGKKLHIGNREYLQEAGIEVPRDFSIEIAQKLAQGFTPVFISEDGIYQGLILVKHELRKNIVTALRRLKEQGIRLVMLTGDTRLSATGFNQQNGTIFDPGNIYAESPPQHKETVLTTLMSSEGIDPKGVWFVGDGLNDAPCARIVTEKGGVSAAMTANDKAAFFTDISLNGSLDYLFEHNKANRFWKNNIRQNQWILAYGAIAFLAFIIAFSLAGIAVSPLIPMLVMSSTTLFTLFNSYRVKLNVDNALNKNTSWLSHLLASNGSIGLLVGASALLMTGLLISTIVTGGLALPAIMFTAGAAIAVSSACLLAAGVMMSAFTLLGMAYVAAEKCCRTKDEGIERLISTPNEEAQSISSLQEAPATLGGRFFKERDESVISAGLTIKGDLAALTL